MFAATFRALYGLWFVAVFALFGSLSLLVTLITPGLDRRRRAVKHLAATIFRVAGCSVRLEGRQHLPDGPCIVVANHGSYLDGIIMMAVLPPNFSFVIKHEMRNVPLAGLLLRRIDSFFVDRSHPGRSANGARQILRAAHQGKALGFFPEGTFDDEPGLRRFRSGAFAAALRTGMPIVPAAIEGARDMLPAGRLLPHPGQLRVTLLPPIPVEAGGHRNTADELAARARQAILEVIDEPDLLADEAAAQPAG